MTDPEKSKEQAIENAKNTFLSLNFSKTSIQQVDELLSKFNINIDTADSNGETGLIKSLLTGNFELAKFFLDRGANMYAYDTGGRTSMMICAQNGYIEFAKLLIQKGYDINKKVPSNNHSVLALAVWKNQLEIVKFLLENGAHINATDNLGWTPLQVAQFNEYTDIIDVLLKQET